MLTGYISPYPYTEIINGLFTAEFAAFAKYNLNRMDDRPGVWEMQRVGVHEILGKPMYVYKIYKTLMPGAYIQSAPLTLQ